MTAKTERATISFANPFSLKELDAAQPAGDYIVETDHELIEGLSWFAYRRVATFLHIPRIAASQGFSPARICESGRSRRRAKEGSAADSLIPFFALPRCLQRKPMALHFPNPLSNPR